MAKVKALGVQELYRRCELTHLPFRTTKELEPLEGMLGQERAVDAVCFGIEIGQDGYNVFVLGPSGTGKESLVRHFVQERAREQPVPQDICYVHNFDDPYQPRLLCVPAGVGEGLRGDMETGIEELRQSLSEAFEGEDYQRRRQAIESAYKERPEKLLGQLQEQARKKGVTLVDTPMGIVFAPLEGDEVLSPEEFDKLPKRTQKKLERAVEGLQKKLQEIVHQIPRWNRQRRQEVQKLERQVAHDVVEPLMQKLKKKYTRLKQVLAYLGQVQMELEKHVQEFIEPEEEESNLPPVVQGALQHSRHTATRRFQVNVLVDHSASEGAPVVYEDHPTYQNLMGRVEHISQMGALVTDFQLIRPGSLHRANGGYLILEARKLLQQSYAWEGLKRALRSKQVRIESLVQVLGLMGSATLEPQPLPLDTKVVLVGERLLYYLLCHYDPEFSELFKVEADFEEELERSPESQLEYARLLATLIEKSALRSFDRKAIGRLIEYSARLAGDATKLSLRLQTIDDLLREADHWARKRRHTVVRLDDVQHAIDTRQDRAGRLYERFLEQLLRGTILIQTEGEEIGQINGLAVIRLGRGTFGRVSRISSRVWPGRGKVMDIERRVELGGPLHSKGVLILSSFLAARFSTRHPLSLSASLVFEQSYSGIDGDSASSAELYALLSAIAEIPLSQSLAVTGSVDQHGRVQAIGGVNEKIEGFFDLCKARGLNGAQGVLIPATNVPHLMLREDVVAAVEDGQFAIYPVHTIDEGIELLTGMTAGTRNKSGRFTKNSFNAKVEERLFAMNKILKESNVRPKTTKKTTKKKT